MNTDLKVESVIAKPGTIAYGFLEAGETQDGSAVNLPIALINGSKDGAILYVQAVSDGDELNGIAVIHHLLNTISPQELCGGIIAVPIANPFAFHFRQAESVVDKKKMNRCFPGDKDGTSSQRIAHKLFHEAVAKAQYCIDIHQGGVSPMIDSVNVRVAGRHRLHKKCIELARVFGIGYVLDQKGPKGQLAQSAPDIGITTIDPELGGCHGWDEMSIQKGIRGIQNVLQYYGFIDGEPEIPERQIVVRKLHVINSNHGGFVKYRVKISDLVEYRQPIADVSDAFGRKIETVFAPKKGIIWSTSLYPMAFSGSIIGFIGVDISYI